MRPVLELDLLLSLTAERGMGFSSSNESNFQKPSEGKDELKDMMDNISYV